MAALSDVILLGPPGSGKGTQAAWLARDNGWLHLSTGDLFRDHLTRRTPLGQLAQRYIDRGELVPDAVTVDIVHERLREVPSTQRVVFDGFPRTVPQAEALDALLRESGRSLGAVVELEVPDEELVRRIAGRATCAQCHAVYNLHDSPPRVAGACDRCGGPVATRSDETPEVVRNRLAVFARKTAPLIDFYRERGLLRAVDGRGEPGEIRRRMAAAVA